MARMESGAVGHNLNDFSMKFFFQPIYTDSLKLGIFWQKFTFKSLNQAKPNLAGVITFKGYVRQPHSPSWPLLRIEFGLAWFNDLNVNFCQNMPNFSESV
jgi:hypothetical protein